MRDYRAQIKLAEKQDREEGIKKGKYEEKLNIAKKLLDVLDDETISVKTGISIDQIRKLRS